MNLSESDEFGCREWLGKRDKDGYGVMWNGPRMQRAHIVAWEAENGPVPDGRVLDHLCGNRACCRVVHLEAVSQRENLFRRRWSYRVRLERCQRGHDMGLHAVVIAARSGRVCRECNRSQP